MLLGVHLLFVDESGQPGESAFAVGGGVVEAPGRSTDHLLRRGAVPPPLSAEVAGAKP